MIAGQNKHNQPDPGRIESSMTTKKATPKKATKKRTRHLPPDPERKNASRARWAGSAVEAFMRETGTDKEDALKDLLGDLMHWADRNKTDFDAELLNGRRYYADETAPTGKECWDGKRGAAILGKNQAEIVDEVNTDEWTPRQLIECLAAGNTEIDQLETIAKKMLAKPEPSAPAILDSRETAIILHGLRMVQETASGLSVCRAAMCEHFEDVDEMTNEEIDDLCARISFTDIAAPQAEQPAAPAPDELAYIKAAQEAVSGGVHFGNEELEVDDAPDMKGNYPKVSIGEDGAFVSAWIWITKEDAGICRECGEPDTSGGDGFDGLCPSCADKTQCSADDCDTVVNPEDPYYATPCGTYCSEHMRAHVKDCEICRNEFPELESK